MDKVYVVYVVSGYLGVTPYVSDVFKSEESASKHVTYLKETHHKEAHILERVAYE